MKPEDLSNEMLDSRLKVLDGEESIYSDRGIQTPPHIEWERLMINRIKQLEGKYSRLCDITRTAIENMSLDRCKKCSHLHMSHHICYMCGWDNSYEEE